MKLLAKIKKWPQEKKRIFSISLAIFVTILVIVLNSAINIIWKDDAKIIKPKNDSLNSLQQSISQIVNEVQPVFDRVFSTTSSTTQNITTKTEEIIEQNNSTSSSFSTTSNIVE
jgi:predicted PurR-regulated permease PerM